MDWIVWIKGLASGIISGVSTAILTFLGTSFLAPETISKLDVSEKLYLMGIVALFSGILSACNFLKQSPLPNGGTKP